MFQRVQLSKHNIPKRTRKYILGSDLTSPSSVCGLWPRADLPEDELFVDTLLARQTRLGIFHSQSKRGSSTLELLLSSKGAEEDAQGDVISPGILSESCERMAGGREHADISLLDALSEPP